MLVDGVDAYKVADELARRNIPVLLGPTTTQPDSIESAGAVYENAALLHKHKVRIAITTGGAQQAGQLPFEAGIAAAYGLDRDEALRAITINPAQILGIADRFGSLEKGKIADVVVAEGLILQPRAKVTRVYIRGKAIDLKTWQEDFQDQYMPRGAKPPTTTPARRRQRSRRRRDTVAESPIGAVGPRYHRCRCGRCSCRIGLDHACPDVRSLPLGGLSCACLRLVRVSPSSLLAGPPRSRFPPSSRPAAPATSPDRIAARRAHVAAHRPVLVRRPHRRYRRRRRQPIDHVRGHGLGRHLQDRQRRRHVDAGVRRRRRLALDRRHRHRAVGSQHRVGRAPASRTTARARRGATASTSRWTAASRGATWA